MRRGVVRGLRLHEGLWEALGREAACVGLSRNGYAAQRLREACEADRAERLRGQVSELERERLRAAGQGIYGG